MFRHCRSYLQEIGFFSFFGKTSTHIRALSLEQFKRVLKLNLSGLVPYSLKRFVNRSFYGYVFGPDKTFDSRKSTSILQLNGKNRWTIRTFFQRISLLKHVLLKRLFLSIKNYSFRVLTFQIKFRRGKRKDDFWKLLCFTCRKKLAGRDAGIEVQMVLEDLLARSVLA